MPQGVREGGQPRNAGNTGSDQTISPGQGLRGQGEEQDVSLLCPTQDLEPGLRPLMEPTSP